MNIDIEKLTKIANGRLLAGEKFKAKTAGRILFPVERKEQSVEEIVEGFIGATEHRIIILISPTSGPNHFYEFAITEVETYQFHKDESKFYFTAAGQHFDIVDVLADPDPNNLVKFIKGKKTIDKGTFEAMIEIRKSLPELLGGVTTSLLVAILVFVLTYSTNLVGALTEFLKNIIMITSGVVGLGTAFFIAYKLFQKRNKERNERYMKIREKEGELFQSIESEIANIIR